MPVLASTFYIAKNYRRFRWDVSGSSSTWTDSSYRYVKWTSGSGALSVLELPMDGVAEVECQIVAGGGGGGAAFETYNFSAYWLPTGGGGGGAGGCYFGTVNLTQLGQTSVTVGTGGAGENAYVVGVGIGQQVGGFPNGYSGTNSSFGTATASAGIRGGGAAGAIEYLSGSYFSQFSYRYWHTAGIGGGSDLPPYSGVDPGSWHTGIGGNLPDGGDGQSSNSGGRPSVLWDGSAYGIGGTGGESGWYGDNGSATVPSGYGNGGSGAKGRHDPQAVNYTVYTDPEDGAGRAGTDGVVIVRWPLVYESAS